MQPEVFRTVFTTPAPPFSLHPSHGGILLIGSCFTDEMGARLSAGGYPCTVNPCGVQYNPASIAALLRCALVGTLPKDSFFEHEGRWRTWLMPVRFGGESLEECMEVCAEALERLRQSLASSEALCITFGTAWIYEHTRPGYKGIVSNCHKVPAREFIRRRLTVKEIVNEWQRLIKQIHKSQPGLKVIFTVSPIRHFKDGAHENTLSKATLQLAIDELTNAESPVALTYFPASELLLDDLRDYRFYAPDMLHPSPVAADYIFARFSESFFSPETRQEMQFHSAQMRRLAHRPLL